MQIRGWVRSYAEQPPRILFNYNFPKYNNDKQLTYDVPLLLFLFQQLLNSVYSIYRVASVFRIIGWPHVSWETRVFWKRDKIKPGD